MKYTQEILQDAVSKSKSVAQVLRNLGLKIAGGTHSHIVRRLKKFQIDTSHFTGQGHLKGCQSNNRLTADEVFSQSFDRRPNASRLRRALIESGVKYRCVKCKNEGVWNGEPLTLHVDHKDGDWQNNQRENLRFMCPNCHSQTKTFGNKPR